MDDREIRLRRIELTLHATERAAEVEAHTRIAVLAVGLTLAASAGIAGTAGELAALPAAASVGGGVFLVLLQLVGLVKVRRNLRRATEESLEAIDRLMLVEGEPDHDGDEDDA